MPESKSTPTALLAPVTEQAKELADWLLKDWLRGDITERGYDVVLTAIEVYFDHISAAATAKALEDAAKAIELHGKHSVPSGQYLLGKNEAAQVVRALINLAGEAPPTFGGVMKRRFKAFQVFKTGCLVIGLAAFLALLMLVASGQGNHYLNGTP